MKKRMVIYYSAHPDLVFNRELLELEKRYWAQENINNVHILKIEELSNFLNGVSEEDTDELILCGDTMIGPFLSPKEFLRRVDGLQTDWWCLTVDSDVFGLRNGIWKNCALESMLYRTGTGTREHYLMNTMPCAGSEVFDTECYSHLTINPMLDEPVKIANMGCPFFKHEVFHREYDEVIKTTLGHQGKLLFNWLEKESSSIIEPLWDFLLKNFHQIDLYKNMHLLYVLSTDAGNKDKARKYIKDMGLLLVMHLYYPDKFLESKKCASLFPRETDLCITTNTEEKARTIRTLFEPLCFRSLDVRVIENRGRDVSSLLVGAADLVKTHEVICFFHDKKTLQTNPGSIGLGFSDKLIENMFGTEAYICNVVNLFSDNKRLGILSPPAPHHADYYFTQGNDWGPNYSLTKKMYEILSLDVPISSKKRPIAPLGTCFWFRARAMRKLFDMEWEYDDFPPEPNNVDGTILHAIERIYPFVTADAGFYPSYLLTDRWAKVEYSSLRYYIEGYNRVCFKHGIMNYQSIMRGELEKRLK